MGKALSQSSGSVQSCISEFCLTLGCKENVLGQFLALDITQLLVACLQALTEWLKTTGIYSPAVLKVRYLKSRCQIAIRLPKALENVLSLTSPRFSRQEYWSG